MSRPAGLCAQLGEGAKNSLQGHGPVCVGDVERTLAAGSGKMFKERGPSQGSSGFCRVYVGELHSELWLERDFLSWMSLSLEDLGQPLPGLA